MPSFGTEVGQHQMWAAQYYRYRRPRQLLTSGGSGNDGIRSGAAMGAEYLESQIKQFSILLEMAALE